MRTHRIKVRLHVSRIHSKSTEVTRRGTMCKVSTVQNLMEFLRSLRLELSSQPTAIAIALTYDNILVVS